MQDHVIYRCVNAACARPMPRPVNFCPYCGAAQETGAHAQEPGGPPAQRSAAATAGMREERPEREAAIAAAAGAAASAAAPSGWSDAPSEALSPAPSGLPVPPASAAQQAGAANAASAPGDALRPEEGAAAGAHAAPAAPTPDAHRFGRSGGARPAAGMDAAPGGPSKGAGAARQEVPRPAIPAKPAAPQRRPVRLRWWLLALAILWGVWLWAKPSARKTEQSIDHAIALARDCKGSAAQAELAALRSSRATPEQLARLQRSLDEEAAACTRRRQRNKAWSDTSSAVEAALAAGSTDKARTRLQAFVRRWGEDGRTRELKERIQARQDERGGSNGGARGSGGSDAGDAHPLAVPARQAGGGAARSTSGRSAATLLAEARSDLAHGDYASAADRMSLCLAMGDSHYRECLAVKAQAEREGMY